MVVFSHLVLGALAFSAGAFAAPSPINNKHATHRKRAVIDGVEIHAFQPLSKFETFGVTGLSQPLSKRQTASLADISQSFVSSRLNLSNSDFVLRTSFANDVAKMAFFRQQINGIQVANAIANVALNKLNNVASFGNNFITQPRNVAPASPKIDVDEAIQIAERAFGGKSNGMASLEYFIKDNDDAVLTHALQIDNEDRIVEVFVDAQDGSIVSSNDFTAHASFRVNPIGNQDPRTGLQLIDNPEVAAASPNGWVSSGETEGNNAISYKSTILSTAEETTTGTFDYAWSNTTDPTTVVNVGMSKVNAFYVVNSIHDITYLYGFTEEAFNFQQDNHGKGGLGGDRISISVQDAAGKNNADFSTPPDGQPARMRMYLWSQNQPNRDGALENDIVAHEATHGTTNRLTGGGTARCLQTVEAGGMGEGWSDAFADWLELTSETVKDFTMGTYVLGQNRSNGAGIRKYPYSTDPKINPLTYSSVGTLNEVHNIGEVWANMLHNVLAALLTANGFSPNATTDASGTAGNVVFMHLFIDQLSLQPCNPTFTTARDAWIQADANRYDGNNTCTLWKAFASRGLGVNAQGHVDDTTVPTECRGTTAAPPTPPPPALARLRM